jgi:hypothetical protein
MIATKVVIHDLGLKLLIYSDECIERTSKKDMIF